MRGLVLAIVALALAVSAAGCAGVVSGSQVNGLYLTENKDATVAHVNGDCWGIYLFSVIPLLTGSTDSPGMMTALTDTVTVEAVVDMTTRQAKKMGSTKLVNLQSDRTSVMVIPLLIWYKDVQVSGNGVK